MEQNCKVWLLLVLALIFNILCTFPRFCDCQFAKTGEVLSFYGLRTSPYCAVTADELWRKILRTTAHAMLACHAPLYINWKLCLRRTYRRLVGEKRQQSTNSQQVQIADWLKDSQHKLASWIAVDPMTGVMGGEHQQRTRASTFEIVSESETMSRRPLQSVGDVIAIIPHTFFTLQKLRILFLVRLKTADC